MGKGDDNTWCVAKRQFLSHYGHPQCILVKVRELFTLCPKKDESVGMFGDHFQKLMREAQMADNQPALTEYFLSVLPAHIQQSIITACIIQPEVRLERVYELANLGAELEAAHTSSQIFSGRTGGAIGNEGGNKGSVQQKGKQKMKLCSVHGLNNTHTTEDCCTLKYQQSQRKDLKP